MIWFELWPARIDLCSGPHLIEFLIEWRRIECWPARVDLWSGPNWNKEGGNGQFELVAAEGMWSEREAFAAFHRVSWGGGGHGGCFFPGETAILAQVHVDLNCEFKGIELSYDLLGLTFGQDHVELKCETKYVDLTWLEHWLGRKDLWTDPQWIELWPARFDLCPGPHRNEFWFQLNWTLTSSEWPLATSILRWTVNRFDLKFDLAGLTLGRFHIELNCQLNRFELSLELVG